MKKRGRRSKYNPRTKKDFKFYSKKFIFWFIIYVVSIFILNLIFKETKIFQAKMGYYLIMGFLLVIISGIVYSASKHKKFRFKGIVLWGFLYSIVFGLVDFILNKIPIQINLTYDKYIFLVVFSIIFTIILMFLRRMKIGPLKIGRARMNSQIFTGIILLVLGIVIWRFSYTIFVGWFNWAEGMAWSWLIGLGLIIAGFLTLIAWWRNNVSMLTTKHTVKWK